MDNWELEKIKSFDALETKTAKLPSIGLANEKKDIKNNKDKEDEIEYLLKYSNNNNNKEYTLDKKTKNYNCDSVTSSNINDKTLNDLEILNILEKKRLENIEKKRLKLQQKMKLGNI
ncbi:hypothetical protein DICPUDRAFT_159181 [Dictyostelium purpureum]|uniref:Uncharacterized protein n=1 Tax=Dictyostelium purpureum TaxID=5786 RepID=F1A3H1_DICPU|nr:uncharacterized protein DICPUDRAFT_159181 [Dictyostelium purpureum]EGC29259.1 hypothetical protein DICPUDRAFT_159181 [Dictyostelium purpureum]|eukprot:XP_003294212.1 hypothetical protein DICPUDRAFT_159181 [Dictyostelium purpureum]